MTGFDLLIAGGLIVDGLGAAPRMADIGVVDGRIHAIGNLGGNAARTIDARGCLVTPGFVDIHTHFDAQATWANCLYPSSNHGVTTAVTGNCGVGFAPCRPEDRDELVRMMEGVEDIPGAVMTEGLEWSWESFPEFLNYLARRRYDMDIAVQLPHSPLRVFVMGQRGLDREPATSTDIEHMTRLTAEAIRAGALGVSTSRTLAHRSSDKHLMPSITSTEKELVGLANGIRQGGKGVLQCLADFDEDGATFGLLRRVVEKTNVPLSFSLMQIPGFGDLWKHILDELVDINSAGYRMKAQIFPRPVGVLTGLELSYNFFSFVPAYQPLSKLNFGERLAALRQSDIREKILSQYPSHDPMHAVSDIVLRLDTTFVMEEVPNYEPAASESVAARAKALGVDHAQYAYDLLIANNGKNVFYIPAANYTERTPHAMAEMAGNENAVMGLGDAGAHYGLVCDSSWPTHMLSRWVDWNSENDNIRMPLEQVIRLLTSVPARTVNLEDRGILAKDYRADLNIIDPQKICLYRPELIHDLPAGGARLHQRSGGYVATVVGGVVTYENGIPTGQLPGRLIRGAQPSPLAI